MGLKVTAEQAGQLVDRAERIVRGHIKRGDLPAVKAGNSWRIDVDDLERVAGWKVDRGRLAALQVRDARTADSMAARIDALEREIEALRRRVVSLELARVAAPLTPPSRPAGQDSPPDAPEVSSYSPSLYRPSGGHYSATVSAAYTPARRGGSGTMRTRADAARWLARHGVNEHTPKSWAGWHDVPIEPEALLRDAMRRKEAAVGNWRVAWELYRCMEDPACVCNELLPA